MKTSKPVGTISYNTTHFVLQTLEELANKRWIEDYRIIDHLPEEEGKKRHFHLIVFPAKRIDTLELRDKFIEPQENDLPLNCQPFRLSEPLNWLMYVLHDPDFLAAHPSDSAGDGKLQYGIAEVFAREKELLEIDYQRALSIRKNTNQKILDLLEQGYNFKEVLRAVPSANPTALSAIVGAVSRLPRV